MKRIIAHWTAGSSRASSNDKEHYHYLVESDGKIVQGRWAIDANRKPLRGHYAAHTMGCNSDSIGVAMCGMHGAVEKPFSSGKFPISQVQWNAFVRLIADLAKEYKIHVTHSTVLSHAEVHGTLKIPQRGKWDIARLSFAPTIIGAKACGDKLRAEVKAAMIPAMPDKPAPTAALSPAGGVPVMSIKENTMLSGYKTYIVAAAMAILGVLSFLGIAIPGVALPDNWMILVLQALGLGALRSAIPPK